jgi:hypothetical protein
LGDHLFISSFSKEAFNQYERAQANLAGILRSLREHVHAVGGVFSEVGRDIWTENLVKDGLQ